MAVAVMVGWGDRLLQADGGRHAANERRGRGGRGHRCVDLVLQAMRGELVTQRRKDRRVLRRDPSVEREHHTLVRRELRRERLLSSGF